MQMTSVRLIVIVTLVLVLIVLITGACSSQSSDTAITPSDPQVGKELFNRTQELAGAPTCKTCHVIEAGKPAIVGPNLNGIATRAGQRVDGQTAEEYIYTSIVDPYAYVVHGYQSSIMVRNYDQLLTQQQIRDIVAYLMTLE